MRMSPTLLRSPLLFPPHACPSEVPTASALGPRGRPRGRAGDDLRGPGVGRGVQGRGGGAPTRAVPERSSLRGREPAPLRLLAGAARPEGPERLPALRPAAAGRAPLSTTRRTRPAPPPEARRSSGGR